MKKVIVRIIIVGMLLTPLISLDLNVAATRTINPKQEEFLSFDVTYYISGKVLIEKTKIPIFNAEIKWLETGHKVYSSIKGDYTISLGGEIPNNVILIIKKPGYTSVSYAMELDEEDFNEEYTYVKNLEMHRSKSHSLILERFPVLFQLLENILNL